VWDGDAKVGKIPLGSGECAEKHVTCSPQPHSRTLEVGVTLVAANCGP
jgi:hypothetical protein